MKRFTAAILFCLPLAILGCNTLPWSKNSTGFGNDNSAVFVKREPQAQDLVAYLNDNARKVQAVQANSVSMDCKQGNDSPIGLEGKIACSRPRNFRLAAKVAGQDQVDIGSNDEEFWFWVAKAPKPVVSHCTYKDMATGKVFLPFPFNPDMVVCTLNMAEYNPNAQYKVQINRDNVIELIEPMKSLQGQDIFRVTYFNRGEVTATRPRVLAYALKDKQGKDICTATMLEVALNKETGAVLPVRAKIVFFGDKPADRFEMSLKFYDLTPTRFDPERAAVVFSRKNLGHLPGYDLAHGPDQPTGTSMSIQRTGGVVPQR